MPEKIRYPFKDKVKRRLTQSYEGWRLGRQQARSLAKDGLPDFRIHYLREVHMEIVHGCQLRCLGCPNSTLLPNVKKVSVEDFDRMLGNIDVELIHELGLFNFGEPLLHPDLPGLLAKIPEQKWKVNWVEIATNGQTVNWDMVEEAIKMKVLDRIAISCDGDGTPESYEEMRPPSKWEKFLEFLERMQALRDKHDPNLHLISRTIITNEAHKERWIKVLKPRGFRPYFRAWKYFPESTENMTGRSINMPEGICLYQEIPDRLYVDWDGTVVPCCAHPKAAVFGNLLQDKYTHIMAGDKRLEWLKKMETNRKNTSICSTCEYGNYKNPGDSYGADVPAW